MTPSKAGRFAEEAKVKRLLLTHIYPQNDVPDLAEQVSAYYSGEVIVAADFMKFEL
jgi:ribonuclease BN (tRNA processing enzyme)